MAYLYQQSHKSEEINGNSSVIEFDVKLCDSVVVTEMVTVNDTSYANEHSPAESDLCAYVENSSTENLVKAKRHHQRTRKQESNLTFGSLEVLQMITVFVILVKKLKHAVKQFLNARNRTNFDDANGKMDARKLLSNDNKPGSQSNKHRCKVCNKLYELKSSLHRHMRVHEGLDEYKCKVCSKHFSDTKSLTGHLLIHTGEKPYICSFCGYKFRNKSTLNVHEKRHGTEMPFKCDVCGKKFFVGVDLRKHMKIQHRDGKLRCDYCDKEFYLLVAFRRHYRSHIRRKPLGCQYCGKYFADQPPWNNHVDTHKEHGPVQDDTRDINCGSMSPCSGISSDISGCGDTQETLHSSEQFVCSVSITGYGKSDDTNRVISDAAEVSSRNSDETNHERAPRNSPGATIGSQQCPAITSVVNNIKDIESYKDRLRENRSSAENVLGEVGDKKMSYKVVEGLDDIAVTRSDNDSEHSSSSTTLEIESSNLRPDLRETKTISKAVHIKSQQLNKHCHLNGKHQCKICNRLYELKSSLNRHMRVHQNIDEYKCKLCNKQFSDTRTLSEHLLIHTGEKPYKCSICEFKFRNKSTLNKHEKRHGTMRPYKCEFCEKQFFQGTDLRKHLKIHEVDKEFKCDLCGKQFYLKAQFRRHYRVHTGEKPFVCNQCKRAFADKTTLKRHKITHTGRRPDPNDQKTVDATGTSGRICNRIQAAAGISGFGIVQETKDDIEKSVNNRMDPTEADESHRKISKDVEERSRTIVKIKTSRKINLKRRPKKSVVQKRVTQKSSEKASLAKDITDVQLDGWGEQDSGINLDNTGMDIEENYSDNDVEQLEDTVQTNSDKNCTHDSTSSVVKEESSTPTNRQEDKKSNAGKVTVRKRQRKHTAKTHGINLPDPILLEAPNGEPFTLMLSCKLCEKNCKNKASYIAHYKACLVSAKSQNPDIANKSYGCTVCKKVYELKASLRRHMRVHQELDEYKCEVCSKQFSDTKSLRGHLLIHTGEKPFSCSFCGFKFRNKSTLRSHETRHGSERPFSCEVCDKKFFLGTDLRKHLKIHETDREFKCDQCARQFYLLAEFRRHYRKHTGERPFECQHCGKCFADQSSLKNHSVIHTGDKPFQCDKCGSRFSWQCRLDKHIRRHNNDRPYGCNTCHKKFIQNSELKTHERKHEAETNHECLRCGERFADSGSLSKHKRIHSPVKNNLCSYCGKAYVTPAVLKRHWTTCTKKMIIGISDDYRG